MKSLFLCDIKKQNPKMKEQMEITIDEYISYRFNNTYVCKQNYGDRFPIEFI